MTTNLDNLSPCCQAPTKTWRFSRYPVRRFGRSVVLTDATVHVCTACHYGWPDPAQVQAAMQAEREVAV